MFSTELWNYFSPNVCFPDERPQYQLVHSSLDLDLHPCFLNFISSNQRMSHCVNTPHKEFSTSVSPFTCTDITISLTIFPGYYSRLLIVFESTRVTFLKYTLIYEFPLIEALQCLSPTLQSQTLQHLHQDALQSGLCLLIPLHPYPLH